MDVDLYQKDAGRGRLVSLLGGCHAGVTFPDGFGRFSSPREESPNKSLRTQGEDETKKDNKNS